MNKKGKTNFQLEGKISNNRHSTTGKSGETKTMVGFFIFVVWPNASAVTGKEAITDSASR